jgi:iron complex outermembrane receptor protein
MKEARRSVLFRLLLSVCCLLFFSAPVGAEEGEDAEEAVEAEAEEEYVLPEVEVSAERDTPELITREEMDRDRVSDLWEAVQYTPGIVLSGGGRRNDSNFTVRGFGPDSVPVYVDGVPLANPYRGEGDSARLLTGDLESVEIEKGFSTELLGANTLGGAVLLRVGKPKKPFEAFLKTGFDLDGIGKYAGSTHVLGVGTKQEYFYVRGVLQFRDVDHFRLSGDFNPVSENPQQGGDRLWSDSRDAKLTFMAGWTPNEKTDVWFTYGYQWADKGLSPPDVNTREYSIWDWPVWKRHSAALNAETTAGAVSVRGLFYFDKYDNRLDEYYNMNAWKLGIHAPHSDYDEFSLGGRLGGSWDINEKHNLQAAVTYKKEDHKGLRGSIIAEDILTEEMHVNEDTWSVGAEYAFRPWKPLTLKAGFGFDALIPLEYWNQENEYLQLMGAEYFIAKSRRMFLYTWQAGVFYKPLEDHELRLTYARKNHFPSMAHRYSTRFGRTLPNPYLGPEQAVHFELGYRGYFGGLFSLNAAVYYSVITGKIVTIQLPNPHNPSALVDYERNLDETAFWGFELAPELTVADWLNAGLAFSFNKYSIGHSQAGVKVLSYYPSITFNGYLVLKLFRILSLIPRLEYIGSRYADTGGVVQLKDYVLANLKLSAEIGKYAAISAGIENIFDTYYEIRLNSPMAGRSFNISLDLRY